MRGPGGQYRGLKLILTEGQIRMNIVIKDSKTGKKYMIKGHGLDYEIFKKSKGKVVNGELKGKGDWVSCRNYPTSLPAAIYKCVRWCLASEEDDEEWVVEAEAAYKIIDEEIRKRVRKIVAEVCDD